MDAQPLLRDVEAVLGENGTLEHALPGEAEEPGELRPAWVEGLAFLGAQGHDAPLAQTPRHGFQLLRLGHLRAVGALGGLDGIQEAARILNRTWAPDADALQ